MKTHIRHIKSLSLTLFVILSFVACDFFNPPEAPYLISGIEVVNGQTDDHLIAGLHFTLKNKDEKAIESIDVEFDIYDVEGNLQPGIGSNHMDENLVIELVSGATGGGTIVMDNVFTIAPTTDLTVTRLCVYKVHFTDKSVWEDKYRHYLYMSEDVVVVEPPIEP